MNLAIFDIDGTLIQTNRVDILCFPEALKQEFGMSSINTDWSKYTYSTDSGILYQLFQENLRKTISPEDISKFLNRFTHLLEKSYYQNPDYFLEVPGARVALQQLKKNKNWGIAIASGGWEVSARLKLKLAQIDIEDIPTAFADDSFEREDIISFAINRAKKVYQLKEFDKVIYIGDAIWDFRAASKLGIPFLGIASNHHQSALKQEGVSCILSDFSDFNKFLKILHKI